MVSTLVTDDKFPIPPSRMIKFTLADLTTTSQVIHIITIKTTDVIIRRRFSVFVSQLGVSSRLLQVEQKKKIKRL
jgi:hypothetical protein